MTAFPREELERLVNRTSLPGVDPTEVRVVREFLRREGSKYAEYRFNVRTGDGVQLQGDYTEKFKADWLERTKMRLDLVCVSPPNLTTLCEAKVQWTNDAVWQLLSYRDHYRSEHPDEQLALVGICEAYTPSAAVLSSNFGIRVHVYGFPPDLPMAPASTESEL